MRWAWGRLESTLELRIAELHKLGMTIRDIATELGVSKSQIHRRMQALGLEVSRERD